MNSDPTIERFYTSTAVHVHHKVHLTAENINDPAIALDRSNLMALCEECHAEQHRTKRWRCDAMGHVTL